MDWLGFGKKPPLKGRLDSLIKEGITLIGIGILGLIVAVYSWGQITAPGLLASQTVWNAGALGILFCGVVGFCALMGGSVILYYTLKLREQLHDQLAREREKFAK